MAKDKLIVTSIEDSKRIGGVLANDKARAILDLLAERKMTAAEIAETMKLPLTTVDYSLKKLISVGLIKSRTGFNKNIRIAKYYEPQEKFIVITPKRTPDVIATLKSVLPTFIVAAGVSILLETFVRIPIASRTLQAPAAGVAESGGAVAEQTAKEVTTVLVNPHYGIVFFAVATTLILLYVLWKNREMLSLRNFS